MVLKINNLWKFATMSSSFKPIEAGSNTDSPPPIPFAKNERSPSSSVFVVTPSPTPSSGSNSSITSSDSTYSLRSSKSSSSSSSSKVTRYYISTPEGLSKEVARSIYPPDISAQVPFEEAIAMVEAAAQDRIPLFPEHDLSLSYATKALLHASNPSLLQEELHSKLISKSKFTSYEADLLAKLLAHPENQEKVNQWFIELHKGHRPKVIKEVQKFINKNIKLKNLAKMTFHSGLEKWNKADAKKRAKIIFYKTLGIPLAPLILAAKGVRTLASKEKRQKAAHTLQKLISGDTFTHYRFRNKIIKGLVKTGLSGVIATAIASEILSMGTATPFLIGFGALGGTALAGKVAHDLAQNKDPILVLSEVLMTAVDGSASGLVTGSSIAGLVELTTIISNSLHGKPSSAEHPSESNGQNSASHSQGEHAQGSSNTVDTDHGDHAKYLEQKKMKKAFKFAATAAEASEVSAEGLKAVLEDSHFGAEAHPIRTLILTDLTQV